MQNINDNILEDKIEDTANFDFLSDHISMKGSELNFGGGQLSGQDDIDKQLKKLWIGWEDHET